MAEERGLGEDLDVEELRRRLKGHGRQLFKPVEPTGGVDIQHRHREEDLPRESRKPSSDPTWNRSASSSQNHVAMVDCLEQRVEMCLGPAFFGRRDQRERTLRAGDCGFERLVLAKTSR